MRRVVVTGMGMVTPLGNDVNTSWENAKAGKNGIDFMTRIPTDDIPVKVAGEVKDFDPTLYMDKKDARRMDRFSQMAMAAAVQAMEDANFGEHMPAPERFGVTVGSGIGGLETLEVNCIKMHDKGPLRVSPIFSTLMIGNIAAGNISIRFGLMGPCESIVTACATGTHCLGDAFRNIKHGYADAMLAGGAEATITKLGFSAFIGIHAMSLAQNKDEASIPFDARRTGFVMGEGAGVLVLEEYEHAVKRNAKIYGEILGFGSSGDAFHVTAPHPEGKGAALAMQHALKEGGVTPEQVGYINAHGTSTVYNDRMETLAVKAVFGEQAYKVPMSATKSMTGHLLGASGAVEAMFCMLAMRDSFLPPTINYKEPDPECDLDVIPNVGREAKVDYALSNSFGFGGHNATLLMGKMK